MTITELETPALLPDRGRLAANVARMNAALKPHGVDLRPHLKTPAPPPPSTTTTCRRRHRNRRRMAALQRLVNAAS
jgi:D-serine deaminase-like pyridoxal phosphate-dependent protein